MDRWLWTLHPSMEKWTWVASPKRNVEKVTPWWYATGTGFHFSCDSKEEKYVGHAISHLVVWSYLQVSINGEYEFVDLADFNLSFYSFHHLVFVSVCVLSLESNFIILAFWLRLILCKFPNKWHKLLEKILKS